MDSLDFSSCAGGIRGAGNRRAPPEAMIQVFHYPVLGSTCADMLQASDSPAINHMNLCIKGFLRSGSLTEAPRIGILHKETNNSFGRRNGVCEKTIYIRLLKSAIDNLVLR